MNKFITFIESLTTDTNIKLISAIKHGYNICFENYTEKLDSDTKRLSAEYIGKNIKWYGVPDQMIVIHKDYVEGMWGNIYDSDKMDNLVSMIDNAEDHIELECSYATGSIITFTDIKEEQAAMYNEEFAVIYDGKETPASIGDEELDQYIGNDTLDDVNGFDLSVFIKYKFDIAEGHKSPKELYTILESTFDMFDDFKDEFEEFIERELELKNAIEHSKYSDIGDFQLTLRDGHHRVFGAIKSGENYICANLDKNDLPLIDGLKYVHKVV